MVNKSAIIYIYIYIYIYIENADATPPHLEVILHLGSSDGLHGSLQFFAFGLRSLFSSIECLPTHLPMHSGWPLFAYWYIFSGLFVVLAFILGSPGLLGCLCGPKRR